MSEGTILYRGSRDELNEMCRVKDERIAELVATLKRAEILLTALATAHASHCRARDVCDERHLTSVLTEARAELAKEA